jgi:hypothetical protein
MLFPYTLPTTSHPPLEERVARLHALSSSTSTSTSGPSTMGFDQTNAKRNQLLGAVAVLAAAAGLTYGLRQLTADAGISPNVESPHGAHFIPLNVLGIPGVYEFTPLTHDQVSEVSTTAKKAVAIAETYNELQPSRQLAVTVSEGSFTSLALSFQSVPAYIVVLSGPGVDGVDGVSKVDVVVDATNDSVITRFWVVSGNEIMS